MYDSKVLDLWMDKVGILEKEKAILARALYAAMCSGGDPDGFRIRLDHALGIAYAADLAETYRPSSTAQAE